MSQEQQQQANEELQQTTIEALRHLALIGEEKYIRLLCWHAGIDYDKEVKRATPD